ncbi:agmatinase [Desulfobacula toluolica]|uniref:SpeB: agmatinase (Agmatine ureohydrolase) n=1 Tax=Desulfobacula toluolica (strain DSM 7467 / Tol2) TaxID=651182 RepID=K0NGZ6_DESTT|nr:agmatinase [Desulfobacula toluolica]CCK78277.1 SpeB: agmatinase (Agmatine ureohydrolase) [Desulfobacula toluolica Tol2]
MSSIPDFIESEKGNRQADKSLFHVIPAPLEASVSYGSGTADGPRAILEASQQLEAWDGESVPLESGIHTTATVDCTGNIQQVLSRIEARVEKSISMGAIPVLLGGEHTVTLGALRAISSKIKQPIGIVQFDAHADLRDEYQGERFSHACVMKRAMDELNLPLFQIGVRAISREEHELRSSIGVGYLDAGMLYQNKGRDMVLPLDFPDIIYLSFDVDGLDPSVIRATGTPVPGGLGWYDALWLIEKCLCQRSLAGFDVVELAPIPGDHGSDFAAAQLVYSIMGMIQRNRHSLND